MQFKGNAASDPNACFPADDYFLTCTKVQDKDKNDFPLKSKKGNDMWVLELTVAEGPHKDRKMWHYLVFIPEGLPAHGMALKCLKAFGINPEGENEILPEHLLNVMVKAAVKVDDKQDGFEPKNQVAKWYMPPEGEATETAAEATEETTTASEPEDPNGTAQEEDSFDPEELERQNQAAIAAAKAAAEKLKKPPVKPAPAPAKPAPAKPAPTPAKKPLWGKKK